MNEAAVLEQHRGLVLRVANDVAERYRLRRFMDDLVASGLEGLLEAHQRFDPSRGLHFSTYAWYLIRGRILDGCRSMGLVARRRGGPEQLRAEAVFNEHQRLACEDAGDEEDEAARAVAPRPLSEIAADLDAMVGDAAAIFLLQDASGSAEAWIDPAPDPEEDLAARSSAAFVRAHVAALDDDDRRVIEMSFFGEHTLDDIAAHFGCSRSWASRMRSGALRRLRERLVDDPGPVP